VDPEQVTSTVEQIAVFGERCAVSLPRQRSPVISGQTQGVELLNSFQLPVFEQLHQHPGNSASI